MTQFLKVFNEIFTGKKKLAQVLQTLSQCPTKYINGDRNLTRPKSQSFAHKIQAIDSSMNGN
jgi:hypothetical protein